MAEEGATTDRHVGPAIRIGRRAKLNRTVIVRAAIALADRSGLEAVTMRAVAAELDSAAAALYRHVRNREELVNLVRDSALTERGEATATGDWQTDLRTFTHGLLELHFAHPWLAAGGLPTKLGPQAVDVVETAMSLLTPHPAGRGQKYSAIAVLFELVAGFARSAAATQPLIADLAPRPGEPDADRDEAAGDHSETINGPDFEAQRAHALTVILAATCGVLDSEQLHTRRDP
ncbi:TetR family transcriptional regulator [Brevibacterium sp. S111]|nr:TetR family transcriptional regulator [Brevibacterium sp. S111]